ncbi:hypothetical protein ABPG72_007813 [Tetrahymena utriculariae]
MASILKNSPQKAAASVQKKSAAPNRIQAYNDSVRSQKNGEDLITSKDFDFKSGDTMEKDLENTQNQGQTKVIKRPDYVNEMSIQDKLINQKIIKNMNKKITFMKNPRFRVIRPPIQFTDLNTKPGVLVDMNDKECPFRAYPGQVIFQEYEIDKIYEIKLNITNIDNVSRRIKYLPPQLSCFSIKEVKYPTPLPKSESDEKYLENQELGMVAPGMSVIFTIQYYAQSLAEQNDGLQIINEINAFTVPIKAKRNPPELNLPQVLDCKSCWIGDKNQQIFKITNKGGDCGFRFFSSEEDEDQMDQDTLFTGNFVLFPCEFYMQHGETQEIVVTFTPEKEGEETKKIILACDNHTSAEYTLKGSGNMAEVAIYGVDDLKVSDFKEELQNMNRMFFENALPGIQKTRKLLLKNTSDVEIKFHWNLFKDIMIQQDQKSAKTDVGGSDYQTLFDNKEDYCFNINPISGVFAPQQILEFQFSFLTNQPVPIFENATFFIDEIPFESIRNVSPYLQQYMTSKVAHPQNLPKDNLPGFLGSNTARPSVAYFDLKLVGLSTWAPVSINKPFQYFPSPLAVHQEYQDIFVLKNESATTINFDISIITTESVICFVEQDTGSIGPNSTYEVKVTFSSDVVGQNQKAMVQINFDISHSLTYEVLGNFVGPSIKIVQPILDFGLMKQYENKTTKLVIENTSPVAVEIAIRDINQKLKKGISNSIQKLTSLGTIDLYGPDTLLDQDEYEQHHLKCSLEIEEQALLIQPFEKRSVNVKCKAGAPESYKTILEIQVEHSNDPLFLNVEAEIQKIIVSLNRLSLDFPCLYVNNVNLIDPKHSKQYIEIQNLGNIEAEFEWEIPNTSAYKIEFEPQKGKLKPKTNKVIKINLVVYKGEILDNIFVCNIKDMKYPLGFQISTKVFGLSVSFERMIVQEDNELKQNLKVAEENDNTNLFNTLIMKSNIKNSMLLKSMRNTQEFKNFEITQKLSKQANSTSLNTVPGSFKKEPLHKLEFFGCQINQPKSIYVILSNTSGIHTKFNIHSENYQPFTKINADLSQSFIQPDISHIQEEDHEQNENEYGYNQGQVQDSQIIQDQLQSPEQKVKQFKSNLQNPSITMQSQVHESNTFAKSKVLVNTSNYRISQLKNKTNRITTVSLITADHEKVKNFHSKAGQELNAARKLDKEQRFYLQNDKGFAIVCEPSSGNLRAHQEQIIKITVFNDISGKIEDNLFLEIEGLETRKIPTIVDVQGSPVIISPYQLGINYKGAYPVFDLGHYMKNGTMLEREFKITNTGPKTVKIEWKMYNLNSNNQEQDFFDLKISDPDLGSSDVCKLNFIPISPPEAIPGEPFLIDPSGMIIHGREEKIFKVKFQTNETNDFISVLIAQPVIIGKDGQEESHIKIDKLILQIISHTQKPQLYLDKLLTHDGKHILKFEKWALFDNKKEHKEICLVNKDFATVKFDLEVEGPFGLDEVNSTSKTNVLNSMIIRQQRSLTKALSSNNQGKLPLAMTYTLEQNTNMKLMIRYKGQKVHDEEAWPMTYKNYEFGKLRIKYVNGDEQEIDLEGHLLRPLIQLNTSGHEDIPGQEIQDFGTVHINNVKRIAIFLSNISKVPAKWKIHHIKNPFKKFLGTVTMTKEERENNAITDDQDVFQFSVTEGLLYGPSIPVKSLPETLTLPTMITTMKNHQNEIIPQQILINFKPKRNLMYKSKYRISVEEGPTVDFILRGLGTYDEEIEQ